MREVNLNPSECGPKISSADGEDSRCQAEPGLFQISSISILNPKGFIFPPVPASLRGKLFIYYPFGLHLLLSCRPTAIILHPTTCTTKKWLRQIKHQASTAPPHPHQPAPSMSPAISPAVCFSSRPMDACSSYPSPHVHPGIH
jgi:hypothetical protein